MNITEIWKQVDVFEQSVAEYAGSKFAVAVDNCTAALFLCCKFLNVKDVIIPKNTYVSVPSLIIQSGGAVKFSDEKWAGTYRLQPYPIIDSACRFYRGMYEKDTFYCLSFQYKKHIPIGRGGMILTDNQEANDWFRKARFNGRPNIGEEPEFIGWNCYMDPERAVRGLIMLASIEDVNPDLKFEYPDLSEYKIFQ